MKFSKGSKHSEETKQKIKESQKKYFETHDNHFKGKKHTKESKKKISKKCKIYWSKEENKRYGKNNPMYGRYWSDKQKQEQSERLKKWYETHDNPMKNKKHSEIEKNKISESMKKRWQDPKYRKKVISNLPIRFGEDAPYWKGGITPELTKLRNSDKYHLWRKQIFERDNYTCKLCDDNKGGNLNSHHIHKFSEYPNERFDINNGITLCENCHELTFGKEEEWIETFLMIQNEGEIIESSSRIFPQRE